MGGLPGRRRWSVSQKLSPNAPPFDQLYDSLKGDVLEGETAVTTQPIVDVNQIL